MIPPVAAWVPFLGGEVGHAPYSTQDGYGEAVYGATTWYPASIEDAVVSQKSGGAAVVTGQLHIIIGAVVQIDPRDRLLVRQPFTSRNSTGAFSTQDNAEIVRVSPSIAPRIVHHHTELWTE